MSLRSFDKFCEDLILKEPGSEKIIYDERQKLVQMKLGIETLVIFGAAAVLNCFVMDMFYQYAESYSMPIVLMLLLTACYYNFRCAVKGCLIGINGVRSLKYSSFTSICMGVLLLVQYTFSENEHHIPIVNEQLSNDFLFLIAAIIVNLYGITTLIIIHHIQKQKNGKTE